MKKRSLIVLLSIAGIVFVPYFVGLKIVETLLRMDSQEYLYLTWVHGIFGCCAIGIIVVTILGGSLAIKDLINWIKNG